MDPARLLSISFCVCMAACGKAPADDASSTGETSSIDETSDTQDTTDQATDTSDTSGGPDGCGDGVVSELEECEPDGPIPCGDDCTLPLDGPGAIEWVFIDDEKSSARTVVVDQTTGRAFVGGWRSDDPASSWLARFEPDGSLAWEVLGMDDGRSITDVTLEGLDRVIVIGREETGPMIGEAWIAAHQIEDGAEAWSVLQPSGHGLGSSSTAVAVLGEAIHVAIDSPTGGIEREPSMMIFDSAGVPGATRTWPIGYGSGIRALAVDPDAMRLVLVGSEDLGNWIEALDLAVQTLWTANEAIDPEPGDGLAEVQSVAIDSAGFLYVVGEEMYNDGQNFWGTSYVRRLSADGQADWTVTSLPGVHEREVVVADDVVYVIGSESNVGTWLVARSAADGELLWQRQIPHDPDGPDLTYDLAAGPGSLWLAGFRWADGPEPHAWVARVKR